MPYPLRDKFNMPLAVCAGGRIRDSKRLLVDIGTRSQDACDALNQYDELVELLAESKLKVLSCAMMAAEREDDADYIAMLDNLYDRICAALAKCTG